MKQINLLLIGLGPHAKRIYFPFIENTGRKFNIQLLAVVDLKSKEKDIYNYLENKKLSPNTIFLDKPNQFNRLRNETSLLLDNLIKKHDINTVIIATKPLSHIMYAKWALKNSLSILMDKPISTYIGVSTDQTLSEKIIGDYLDLCSEYKKAKRNNVLFLYYESKEVLNFI